MSVLGIKRGIAFGLAATIVASFATGVAVEPARATTAPAWVDKDCDITELDVGHPPAPLPEGFVAPDAGEYFEKTDPFWNETKKPEEYVAADAGRPWEEITCHYDRTPVPPNSGNVTGDPSTDEFVLQNSNKKLDAYIPDLSQQDLSERPILVWIHGGGLTVGSKVQHAGHRPPQLFASQGIVTYSVNYTLRESTTSGHCAPPPGNPWDIFNFTAIIAGFSSLPCNPIDAVDSGDDTIANETVAAQDAAKAVKWAHDRAVEGVGDPNRIIVAGHSAGAILSFMLVSNPGWLRLAFADPTLNVTDVIAGAAPMGISPNLHWIGSSDPVAEQQSATHLPPLDFSVGDLDTTDLLAELFDVESRLTGPNADNDGDGENDWGWEIASPTWHILQQEAAGGPLDVPPMIMIAGGGDCGVSLANMAFHCEDFPDPPAFADGMQDLRQVLDDNGVPAVFIQPLLSTDISFFGQTRRCDYDLTHSEETTALWYWDDEHLPVIEGVSPSLLQSRTSFWGCWAFWSPWQIHRDVQSELQATLTAFVESARSDTAPAPIWTAPVSGYDWYSPESVLD